MRNCSFIGAVQLGIIALSLVSGGVARAEVSLGASFGYTHLTYTNIPNFTNDVFGIPGTQAWGQPGIRVGYLAPGGRWDLNTDIGLVHRSGTLGEDETTIQLLPQFQLNGNGRGGVIPFVNGGVGIQHERASTSGTSSVTATRPVFSVGIGVRKSVSDGHGLVRVELDYGHLSERRIAYSPSNTFIFPSTNHYSVKLGFDLLLARAAATRP